MAMKRNVNVDAAKDDFDAAVEEAGKKVKEETVDETSKTEKDFNMETEFNGKSPVSDAAAAVNASVAKEKTKTPAPAPAKRKTAPTPSLDKKREMVNVFGDLENQFIADFGVLPRIKASNGNCMDGDDKSLGVEIEITVLSWNSQFVASPCSNDAPSDLVKYSLDRNTFDDGTGSLEAYITDLRSAGYPNACVKEYYDLVAVLVGSDKPSELVGEMVQLQLSPTSVKAFNGFRLQSGFKIASGLLTPDSIKVIKASAEVISSRGNTWTRFSFKS